MVRRNGDRCCSTLANLGDAKQREKLDGLMEELGPRILPITLDLWKNSGTNQHFAALCTSWLELVDKDVSLEKTCVIMKQFWEVKTGLLDFAKFEEAEHSGSNIEKWLVRALASNDWDYGNVLTIVPDGASTCLKACAIVEGKDPCVEWDVCVPHNLGRSTMYSIGTGGKTVKNDVIKTLLKKNNRVSSKLRNVVELAQHLEKVQKEQSSNNVCMPRMRARARARMPRMSTRRDWFLDDVTSQKGCVRARARSCVRTRVRVSLPGGAPVAMADRTVP